MSQDKAFDKAFKRIKDRHAEALKRVAEGTSIHDAQTEKAASVKESTQESTVDTQQPELYKAFVRGYTNGYQDATGKAPDAKAIEAAWGLSHRKPGRWSESKQKLKEGILGVIARKIHDAAKGKEGVSKNDFHDALASEQDNIAREVENLLKYHFGIVVTDEQPELGEEGIPPMEEAPPKEDEPTPEDLLTPPEEESDKPPMGGGGIPPLPKGKLGPESRITESLYDMVLKAVVDQAKNGRVDDSEVRRQVEKHIDHIVRDIEKRLPEYDVQVVQKRTADDMHPEQTWDKMSQSDINKLVRNDD